MTVQEVDQEPHRRYTIAFTYHAIIDTETFHSVQLTKRIDTRIPDPLLSNVATATAPKRPVGTEVRKLVPQLSWSAMTASVRPSPLPTAMNLKPSMGGAGSTSQAPTEAASSDHDVSRQPAPDASTGLSTLHPATTPPVDVPDSWDDDS